MKKILIVLLLLSIISGGLVLHRFRKAPKISITPEKALLDQSLEIIVSNLAAHDQVVLEASCKDKDKNIWKSNATFRADKNGIVNVAKQAPISGSYKGIDPMGLFWSMTPTDKDASKHLFSKCTLNICEVLLSVSSQNKLLAQTTIYRLPASPDIERKDIREQGIVGTFFYPKNMKKGPGIIVVPGWGSRIPEAIAQLLASHGYAVLALAYYAAEGLPENLVNIPLEYFHKVMQWFKQQPQVDERKIAFCGHSRGGELVLLLAATFSNEIAAVIANGSPSLVLGDFSSKENSAWTYKNTPIPFMPNLSEEGLLKAVKEGHIAFHQGTIKDPLEERDTFVYAMKKFSHNLDAATIPVEKISCPMLILSGEADKMFPSTLVGELIMERLDKKGSNIKRKHIHFPQAGHTLFITLPNTPSIDVPVPFGPIWGLMGGTAEGNAKGNKESWKEVLNFLKETLQ